MIDEPDDILIQRILNGDHGAFEVLMAKYSQPLLSLIRRQVPDVNNQDDVFQETLIHAWRDLAGLRDRGRLRAWLVAVARNRCCEFHRKTAKQREAPTESRQLESYLDLYCCSGRDVSSEDPVGESLRNLTAVQRDTARLHYLDGLKIHEIARRLNRPEGTIKSQLYHARKILEETYRWNRNKE